MRPYESPQTAKPSLPRQIVFFLRTFFGGTEENRTPVFPVTGGCTKPLYYGSILVPGLRIARKPSGLQADVQTSTPPRHLFYCLYPKFLAFLGKLLADQLQSLFIRLTLPYSTFPKDNSIFEDPCVTTVAIVPAMPNFCAVSHMTSGDKKLQRSTLLRGGRFELPRPGLGPDL